MVAGHIPDDGAGVIERPRLWTVAMMDEVDEMRFPVAARVQRLLEGPHFDVVAVVLAHAEADTGLRGLAHERVRLFPIQRHAFLDQHMLASGESRPTEAGVRASWRADDQCVGVDSGERLFQIREAGALGQTAALARP